MSTIEREPTIGNAPGRTSAGSIIERALRAGPTLVFVSVMLPALLLGLAAWQNWKDVRREAVVRVERTLRTLREHAVKVFDTQKLVIDQVNARLRYLDLQKEVDRAELHQVLKGLDRDLGQVTTIAVTDATGHLIASSKVYPINSPITFADRDWFRAVSEADTAIPFVSRAQVGRQSKLPVFTLAGRIKTGDGRFQGAIAVSISRSYFEAFYREIEPSDLDLVVLARDDGQILARQPPVSVTTVPAGAPFFRSLHLPEGTAFEATSVLDNVTRLFAYRKVAAYPVHIGFGLSKASIVAAWRAHVLMYASIASVASLALLAVSALAMRENRRERVATARWRSTVADLRAEAQERERVEAHLRQSQKMEAVGQLTSGIAHDFNNMLGATIGSLDLLAHRMKTNKVWDDRAQRTVDNALEGAWRAVNLTQRLLAFSRRQALAPCALDVNQLIEGMSDLIRRSINEDVRIETHLQPGVWPTYCDPNQLESALLNLIINARDAMPGGGHLTLSTHNCERQAAHVAGGSGGRCVAIVVADTGGGMPEDVLARAFDPFFTTKDVGKGSGLGLAQVDGFVRQSSGTVTIDSTTGLGTTVRITLPAYVDTVPAVFDPSTRSDAIATAPPRAVKPVPVSAETRGNTPVVLVVEDEAQLRRVSAEALRQLGYRVLEAAGPADALDLLERAPPLALLFTDVVMPGMSGAVLAERIRRRQPCVRTLYATGYSHDAVTGGNLLDPDADVLVKPFTIDQLAAAVTAVLARPERTLRPSAA